VLTYHAVLQQVQAQHRRLLVLQPVGGDLAAAAIEDEVVGTIPGFDHVQPLADLAPQVQPVQVAAKKGGAQRLAQLDQRSVSGMLQIGAGEAAQDVCRGCGAEPKRCRELHHLVVLPVDQVPVDRPRQHRSQPRVGIGFAGNWTVEALGMDTFESRQQVEAEQVAEGEGHVALTVAIDIGLPDYAETSASLRRR
jgi:hypothetical protein